MAITYVGGATAVSAGNTDVSVSLTALSGGSGSAALEGDLVIFAYNVADADNVDLNPVCNTAGFTEIADLFGDGTNDANLGVYWKFMGSSPDTSVVGEGNIGGTDTAIQAVAMVFRGVRTVADGGPFDVALQPATGTTGGNPDPPSIDTSGAAGIWTVIVGANAHTANVDGTFSAPTNYTTDFLTVGSQDTADGIIGMGYNASPSDPENPGTMTSSATATGWCAVTIALSQAPEVRRARVSWAELEVPTAPRRARVSWAELEVPTAPRRARVSWAELEIPDALRRARVSWTELEIPNAPRRARVSWAEIEVPTAPRRARVSWTELEVPTAPRRARVSWAELELPTAPRRARVSWVEMEVPSLDATRRAQVSWAEFEIPNAPRRARVSWVEMEVPTAPRRGRVSWAEFEVPNAPRRARISWAEFETPNAPRRARASWAEMEVPDDPRRRARMSWAEMESPNPPRRARVSWAELQVPDVGGGPVGQRRHGRLRMGLSRMRL